MRTRARLIPLGLTVLIVATAAACRRGPALCAFCQMPIPAETAASVEIGGTVHHVCDPRCALTHGRQTGERTVLMRVTDFATGAPLDPAAAFYLTGSDTAPDVSQETLRKPTEPVYREWHRCLPSVLAFRSRSDARRHQREHGGTVQTLDELVAASAGGAPGPPR